MRNKNNFNPKRQLKFINGVATFVEIEDTNNINAKIHNKTTRAKKHFFNKKCIKNLILSMVFFVFLIGAPFCFVRNGVYFVHTQNLETIFLKMWHIDSFEGGSGNRKQYLEKIAIDFHRINPNIFIVVQELDIGQLQNAIQNDDRPDLISFSHHVANSFNKLLLPLDIKTSVREDLIECGSLKNKLYGVPWYMSGYTLIGNSQIDDRVLAQLNVDSVYSFDKGQYNYLAGLKGNYGQVALMCNTKAKCDLTRCDSEIFSKSSYQAYVDFVQNKGAVLLGNARDFFRVKNRVSAGSMGECKFVPLAKFTDLVQYMGVLRAENIISCSAFIEYLLSSDNQKKLGNIGLFSTTKLHLYTEKDYKEFEKQLNMPISSFSIFESEKAKEKIYCDAINAMK